jgi:hypothetical protein
VKTFLLTYQSFTTPSVLLRKLIERYHVPRQPYNSRRLPFDEFDKLRIRIQLRVCNVIQQWTKKYGSDFVDSATNVPSTKVTLAPSLSTASGFGAPTTQPASNPSGSASLGRTAQRSSRVVLGTDVIASSSKGLVFKEGLLAQIMEFAENVVSEDHILLAKQIRKNIMKLVGAGHVTTSV